MIALFWCLFAVCNWEHSYVYGLKQNTPSNSFVYRIGSQSKLDQFINAKNGYRLKTKVMNLHDLDFQLHFYPEGRFPQQMNQFIVYLCINNLSHKIKISSIFIDWNLFIYEIDFSWIVKDRHHSDTAKCRGFAIQNNAHILGPLKELYNDKEHPLRELTFGVTVNIKTIFDTQQIIENEIPIQIRKHNRFVWDIQNKHILDEMLISQHQQTYASDLYNDLFFLSISPNGYHQETVSSLDMFLHIVSLPTEISKLRMKCIFRISELGITHEFDAVWTNNDKGWGWPKLKYPTDMLGTYAASANFDRLTLIAQCETLEIFDEYENPMSMKKQWKQFDLSVKDQNKPLPSRYAYISNMFDESTNNSDYCVASNVSNDVYFENMNNLLIDMSQDMDILRQQLFVTIGIFTMNLGVTVFIFTAGISAFCCGCL